MSKMAYLIKNIKCYNNDKNPEETIHSGLGIMIGMGEYSKRVASFKFTKNL